MSHQTGSNGRLAKKKGLFFALWKNDITDVSLFASYCYFIQEARHGFRKKEINCLAQQTICSRTLNEQTLMRKYLCVYWRRYQSSSLGVCCSNEIPFVASSLSAKKKEMNTEQCRQQSSLAVEHRLKHLENCYAPHLLEVNYIKDLLFFFSSAHSPLHESIFYEFSHPCCPSQGIFPLPAFSFRGQDVGREKIS